MAPTIRFFGGAGGARIAYAVDGDGPPLVLPAWWVSHVERDFENPTFRSLFERFAEHFTVVRYDRPGIGLSSRGTAERSLASELANLDALLGELGGERVALLGGSCGGPPAIAYAAEHAERVSHLVLYGAYGCGPRLAPEAVQQAMLALVRAHWGLGSKALTDLFAPEATNEERQQLIAMQRSAASAESAAELLALIYRLDVAELLGRIRVPTAVLHRKGDRAIPFEEGRRLASRIPGATFVPLAGSAHLPWMDDWRSVADATLAFLAPTGATSPSHEAGESCFVREGEVWRIAFAGRRCHLKHARGLVDLALLLARPGEEVASTRLMDGTDAPLASASGADALLDERARRELRARIDELGRALAEAEAAGDPVAAARATDERDGLLRELRVATGLGGRRRALADPAERARKAVSGRIRESIDKLRTHIPELGRHLDRSITTGTFCAYRPDRAIHWRT